MELTFTDEQEELRASIRSVLAKECPIGSVRAHVERVVSDEPSDTGRDLWQTFCGLDWPALTVDEAHGGIGLGFVELAVLAEELGRFLVPGPLLATMATFVPLVREAGGGTWLERVAAGEISATAIHDAGHVLCGAEVDVFAMVDGDAVVVVPAAQATIEPIRALDATRTIARVRIDADAIEERLPIDEAGVGRAIEEATVAIAFETLGTCQAIFETNLEYAKQRHQFGVPIGSFQAVKHKLADMYVALERARGACVFAAATIAEDDPRRTTAVSAAKAATGDCQRRVSADGIQLLGGIGYTWEHDQHLFVKRAKTGDALYGTASVHRQRIAEALGLWTERTL